MEKPMLVNLKLVNRNELERAPSAEGNAQLPYAPNSTLLMVTNAATAIATTYVSIVRIITFACPLEQHSKC